MTTTDQTRTREQELRELDAAVAVAIGFRQACYGDIPEKDPSGWLMILQNIAYPYSTSADAVLAAYGVMRERGWRITAGRQASDGFWILMIEHLGRFGGRALEASAESFPEALCRAIVAAAAMEGESL